MTVNEIKIQLALGLLTIDDLIDMVKPPPGAPWVSYADNVASKEVLIYLSDHEYSMTRYHVACNFRTPMEVLRKLSTDENWHVRAAAECTIRRIEREKGKTVE